MQHGQPGDARRLQDAERPAGHLTFTPQFEAVVCTSPDPDTEPVTGTEAAGRDQCHVVVMQEGLELA